MKQLICISLLLFCFQANSQSHFKIDSLFAVNGINSAGQWGMRSVDHFIKNNNGSYFIAGNVEEPLSEPPIQVYYPSVVKINPCGKIDSTYSYNGIYNGLSAYNSSGNSYSHSFLFDEDGSCILTGYFDSYYNYVRPLITKINSAGLLEYYFSTSTLISDINTDTTDAKLKFISSELKDTNKLFCTGFYEKDTINYIVFAQYELNGNIDIEFEDNGIQLIDVNNLVNDISDCHAINENERLFFCADLSEQLIVIKTNGNIIDTAFGSNGYLHTGHSFYSQNLLEDNHFLVASNLNVTRYELTGEIDTTFGNNGVVGLPLNIGWHKIGIDSLPDNRYLISDWQNNYFLNNEGKLDSSFTPNATLSLYFNNEECSIKKSIELSNNEVVFAGISESPWGGTIITRLTKEQNVPNLTLADDTLFSNISSGNAIIQWFLDGIEIANQTSFITLSETGQYVVQISDTGGCNQLSDTLQIIITADKYNANKSTSEHAIYPNPCNEFITISNSLLDDNYEIYSVEGKCVQKGRIEQINQTIHTDELEEGIYLFSSQKGLRHRFIVSR